MKPTPIANPLPPSVARKLKAIRTRLILFGFLKGMTLSLAILLAAMLAAMGVDWSVGWFDPRARYFFTLLALAAAAAGFVFWCLRPLARKRTIISTARELDSWMPQLEERWSTVTELSQNQDAPEVRGSERMIEKVIREAEAAEASVTPATLLPPDPVFRAARWLAAGAAILLLLFAFNFTQTNLLLQRFWAPGQNISLTRVKATPSDVWVPKGEPLVLNATLSGRIPNSPPQLFLRSTNRQVNMLMTPKAGLPNQFQHAFDPLSESFEYRVRSGDGQTAWHRITIVDRPRISQVSLKVTPPSYSNLPTQEKDSLPHSIRVLEGTGIEVGFRADQPLERMSIEFGDGKTLQLTPDQAQWYRFRIQPTNSFTFTAAAINQFNLDNKTKPGSRVVVYEDLPPTVSVLTPKDDVTVRPGEKVDITFEAADDFGLAKAEILVTTTRSDGTQAHATLPVELGPAEGARHLQQTAQLDPGDLGLKHGDRLTYVVQVTDSKQIQTQAAGGTDTQETQPGSRTESQIAPEPAPGSTEEETADTPASPQLAETAAPNPPPSEGRPESQPSEPQPGNNPPPSNMAMRMLDAGQSSSCKPLNITVDEYLGRFDDERKEKLQIAIDSVLRNLEVLLDDAQRQTDYLKQSTASEQALPPADVESLTAARNRLTEATEAIADLNGETAGTPYAMIGLQLLNIEQTHITPANTRLDKVTIDGAEPNKQHVVQAGFHIARAREMLAELTRTYEQARRDDQAADALEQLNKMYQVFLEDTQALLGNQPGTINSFQRKTAEVDEAFVEKLKELEEEKKAIMAELAKLLAEDPRMLRRYLAMLSAKNTSYRDQMTLLARRQEQIQQQVAAWNSTPEEERPALIGTFRESYVPRQTQLVQEAVKLRENLVTWLPLDVKPEQIEPTLAQAEKIAQDISASPANHQASEQALAGLRELRETIPQLGELTRFGWEDDPKMASFIAHRLTDIEKLITSQSGQMKINQSLETGDFPKVAEIIQQGVTAETVALGGKLDATEKQVASMSEEIAHKAAQLNQILQTDIIPPQTTSVEQLGAGATKAAEELLGPVVPAFARAEQAFDELMRLIIAKMDEAPPPGAPGSAPDLESLLALLEEEMRDSEGLGIPSRPINVSILRDWMNPNSNPGQGLGQAQAQAAQAQAQQAEAETGRMEEEARQRAQSGLAQTRPAEKPEPVSAPPRRSGEDWNRLASRLKKDLLQGRDNTPPAQYRDAIENYFKTISNPEGPAKR